MLSIGKIAAGPQAAKYYTDQVADGREDYYSGEGEAPGRWLGSGAASIGLTGEVEAGQLVDLLAGAGLRKVRAGSVAAVDLTFRAPKSVSVLWGIGDPELVAELGRAHDAAVVDALSYLERNACWGRRGAGGAIQVRGGGFIAAAFRHRASRAGDPLLHTHVVIGNLTRGSDGRWTALDSRHVFRHLKTAGYLYQAALRREVTVRLGLEWGPVDQGAADLRVVPRGVIEHFSRRRAEILEHMAEHGGRSASSAQVAALETRRAKQPVNAVRLREEWRSRAVEHGLDIAAVRSAPRDNAVPLPASVPEDAMTENKSVFGRAELLQALAAGQARGASVADLELLADAAIGDPELVELPAGRVPAGLIEPRFSTRTMLEVERDLLSKATASVGRGIGTVGPLSIERVLSGSPLSQEQRAVVLELCGRGDGVSVLRAPAGTGKTFALDAARAAWQSEGFEVLGCALSARAALELNDQAGIPSVTIARLAAELDARQVLGARSVLVIDEAGMVGTRDLARLAAAAHDAGAKLLLVGDDRQLPEIEAGGAFRGLAERLPASELHEVRRQTEAWDRQALDALRRGDVERWASAYRQHGQITVGRSAGEARAALVNDWARAGGDRLMIAARRDDVADLNCRGRELLQARGEIGPDALSAGGREYAIGDRVVGTRNDRHAGILNGQRGTVVAIEAGGQLEVKLDSGQHAHPTAHYVESGHLDHGYAITAHRAQGATVDRTFVLGGEDLYREWGYTALSRHREEARFYVARGDLRINGELPPRADPVIDAIAQLMTRSQAKELAVDALVDTSTDALEQEHRELGRALARDAPPQVYEAAPQRVTELRAELAGEHEQRRALEAERSGLGWRGRGRRADLDLRIANVDHRIARLEFDLGRWSTEVEREAGWLGAHAPEAVRLLAIDRALRSRDDVMRRVATLDIDPLAPRRDRPRLGQDIELDL